MMHAEEGRWMHRRLLDISHGDSHILCIPINAEMGDV